MALATSTEAQKESLSNEIKLSHKLYIESLSKSEKKIYKRELYRQRLKERRPQVRRQRRQKHREQKLLELKNLNEDEIADYKERERKAKLDKIEKLKNQENYAYEHGQRVCINFSFDDIMSEKELASLAKQLSLSYHAMRRGNTPLKFHFTSFYQDSLLHKECMKHSFNLWKVHEHTEPFWEIFPKEEIIVLSPDATEDIDFFEKGKVYVIGGIVDRSISAKQSYYQAKRLNLTTKKLPIQNILTGFSNSVLNINHVVEIIIEYIENGDWRNAIETIVPFRKKQSIGRNGLRRQKNRKFREETQSFNEEALKNLDSKSDILHIKGQTSSITGQLEYKNKNTKQTKILKENYFDSESENWGKKDFIKI